MGGSKITLADFQSFNEIMTVKYMMGVDISKNVNVNNWFN